MNSISIFRNFISKFITSEIFDRNLIFRYSNFEFRIIYFFRKHHSIIFVSLAKNLVFFVSTLNSISFRQKRQKFFSEILHQHSILNLFIAFENFSKSHSIIYQFSVFFSVSRSSQYLVQKFSFCSNIRFTFFVRKLIRICICFVVKINFYFSLLRYLQYSMILKFSIRHFLTIDLKMNCSIKSQIFFNIFNNVYIFIANQNCSIC